MASRHGNNADEKTARIYTILKLLSNAPNGMTKVEVCKANGMDYTNQADRKKINRDYADLRNAGFSIESRIVGDEHRDFLEISDERLNREFTEEQQAELARAARLAGQRMLVNALAGANAELPEDETVADTPNLSEAQFALQHRCHLTFVYNGKPRSAHPHRLDLMNGKWYFQVREDDNSDTKCLLLERIEDLKVGTIGSAEPLLPIGPPVLDPMAWSKGTAVDATVVTTPEQLELVLDAFGRPRCTTAALEDGSIEVSFKVTNFEAFMLRLVQARTACRLTGSEYLKEKVRTHLQEVASDAR